MSNNKRYGMNVFSMKKGNHPNESDNDYVLVQVTSTPQVTYTDSQDLEQTDDFDVTLIITNLGAPALPNERVLRLKFYIIVTSRRFV